MKIDITSPHVDSDKAMLMEKKIEALLKKDKLTDEDISFLIDASDSKYLSGEYSVSETIILELLSEDGSNSLLSSYDKLYLSLLLAKIHLKNSKPLDAESILDNLFSESLKIFGPKHCFSLSVIHHLARTKSLLGKHKEASQLFLREVFVSNPLDRNGELYEGAYEAYCYEKSKYMESLD